MLAPHLVSVLPGRDRCSTKLDDVGRTGAAEQIEIGAAFIVGGGGDRRRALLIAERLAGQAVHQPDVPVADVPAHEHADDGQGERHDPQP